MQFCRNIKTSLASSGSVVVLLAAAFLANTSAATAFAQTLPASGPCFDLAEGHGDATGSQILLNRCTGRSWILTRITRNGEVAYRWIAIAPPRTESVASPLPPRVALTHRVSVPLRPDDTRCFTFAGRRYCE
jgi:hypothetical protein